MKAKDLPEQYKRYYLMMSNKKEFRIDGKEKEAILDAEESFIQLKSGDVINKSFIVFMALNHEATVEEFRKLPSFEQRKITGSIELL